MISRLALRSLTAHPVRSAVLAVGFGAGVAVMAILLGVAQIVLQQAQSPALVGGGDVVIRLGRQIPAALLLSGTLQADALRTRIATAAPTETADLYLSHGDKRIRVAARGGVPSLERALGDRETSGVDAWRDTAADRAWTRSDPGGGAARDRPLSPDSRRAGVGRLVGRVALLQRPRRRRALLPHVPRRPADARRPARGRRAAAARSAASAPRTTTRARC